MKYYLYTNNNIKLNNYELSSSGKKLLEDVIFVDIYILSKTFTIIRGIYKKKSFKKENSNYILKDIVLIKSVENAIKFSSLPSEIKHYITPFVHHFYKNDKYNPNETQVNLFVDIICGYVVAERGKEIKIPMKNVNIQNESKSEIKLIQTRDHLTKYIHGHDGLYYYSIIIIDLKDNLGSVIVCFNHSRLQIEYTEHIPFITKSRRFKILIDIINKIVFYKHGKISNKYLMLKYYSYLYSDKPNLKLKILVPYYKSKNELKNIQVFDKFDQKNIYNKKFITNLSLETGCESIPFD